MKNINRKLSVKRDFAIELNHKTHSPERTLHNLLREYNGYVFAITTFDHSVEWVMQFLANGGRGWGAFQTVPIAPRYEPVDDYDFGFNYSYSAMGLADKADFIANYNNVTPRILHNLDAMILAYEKRGLRGKINYYEFGRFQKPKKNPKSEF